MKNIKLVLLVFFGLVLFASESAAQFDKKQDYVALYRLYNSRINDHLYTTSCDEKDNAVRNSGYVYEGVTGYIATRQMRRSVPLYRLTLNSGEHFYTIDSNEVNNLTANPGNKSEGIIGYVASSEQRNTLPLYRLVNGDRHLYTTDEQEKNSFLQRSGSRLEDTSGYVWTSGSKSCDSGDAGDYPVIYSKTDFTGSSQVIENDWNVNNDWDGSPNMIRAIRVPKGWFVTIYTKKNFRGKSFLMSNDAVFVDSNEWYDRIASIKVSKGSPPR